MSKILFTSVEGGHAFLEEGHWFFHEGQWAVCASAAQYDVGDWGLQVYFEKVGKPLPEKKLRFELLAQAKEFVSTYFEQPVVDCSPGEFPEPESL